jgi:hypothetical protein
MYLEIDCPGQPLKGKVYSTAKAHRKYRQLTRFKQSCAIRLYEFDMNRLRLVAQRRPRRRSRR